MSIFTRGLVINIQRRESGVIYLVVSAEKNQKTPLRRMLKYIADTLFSIADRLHPRKYDGRGLSVIKTVVIGPSADDPLSGFGQRYIAECLPTHAANGDTDYETFLIYEGVKDAEYAHIPGLRVKSWRQEGADYSQLKLPEGMSATILMDDTP